MAFSVSYVYQLLDRYSAPLKKIGRAQDRFTRQIRRSEGSLSGFGKSMSKFSTLIVSAGAVMAGRGVLGTYINFTQALNNLSATSLATSEQLGMFEKKARSLGATTAFTAAEVVRAMVSLTQAGLSVEETLTAIESTLQLAAAGNIDMASAADFSVGIMRQYAFEAEDLVRVNNNLAASQVTSLSIIRETAEAYKYIGFISRKLGLEIEATTALVATLADVNIKGSEGGIALKNLFKEILSPTDKARKAFRRLGIDLRTYVDATGEMGAEGLKRFITDLKKSSAKIQDYLGDLFGERGVKAILALVDEGAEGLQKRINKIRAMVEMGVISEMAKRQMMGLPGMIKEIKSVLQELQIALFASGLDKSFEVAASGLRDFLQNLSETGQSIMYFFGTLLTLLGAFVAMVAGIKLFATFILPLFGPHGLIIVGIMALTSAIVTLEKKFKFFSKTWAKMKRLYLGREGEKPFVPRSERVYQPIYGSRFSQMKVDGKIDLKTDENTKVKESTLNLNMPGNLGFNVAE